jgi:hypothetical protein
MNTPLHLFGLKSFFGQSGLYVTLSYSVQSDAIKEGDKAKEGRTVERAETIVHNGDILESIAGKRRRKHRTLGDNISA